MINNDIIQERIIVLDADLIKVRQKLAELEQQRLENVALMNALTGARQQCDNFLQTLDDVEPEVVSDSSDVDN